MTVEQFASLMSGIQSLVSTLAIVGGGAWALYTFWALGQITRSRAELQQLQLAQTKAQKEIADLELQQRKTEAEIHKLEQEAKVGEIIEISIKPTQRILSNDVSRYVSAVVEIENKGISNSRLGYDKTHKPLLVFAVDFKDDGSPVYRELGAYPVPVARSPNVASPSVLVHAGGKERIPFFFRVDAPGLYLLVFWARASAKEQDTARELGFKFPGNWVAKEYFVVD